MPASDFVDLADASGIPELPCEVDRLLDRPLGVVELAGDRETHAHLPE